MAGLMSGMKAGLPARLMNGLFALALVPLAGNALGTQQTEKNAGLRAPGAEGPLRNDDTPTGQHPQCQQSSSS